jgi:hypothetical protein
VKKHQNLFPWKNHYFYAKLISHIKAVKQFEHYNQISQLKRNYDSDLTVAIDNQDQNN